MMLAERKKIRGNYLALTAERWKGGGTLAFWFLRYITLGPQEEHKNFWLIEANMKIEIITGINPGLEYLPCHSDLEEVTQFRRASMYSSIEQDPL